MKIALKEEIESTNKNTLILIFNKLFQQVNGKGEISCSLFYSPFLRFEILF